MPVAAPNPAETPSIVQTFDCDSLQFDHTKGGWRPTDESLHELTDPISGLGGLIGAVAPIPTVCPSCSFFEEGRCHWCEEGMEDYPECSGCNGRREVPKPWYKRSEITVPLLTTIAVTVVATIGSAIALRRLGLK